MQNTMSSSQLLSLCEQAVEAALQEGAEHAEVYASDKLDLEIGLQKNDLDLVATAQESTFGIRVIHDGRQGFATANRPSRLRETAAEALALARVAPRDPLADLASPDGPVLACEPCSDPAFDEAQTEDMVKLAMRLLKQALGIDPRLTVDSSELSLRRSTQAIASSRGLSRSWRGSAAGGSIFGMAVDGKEVGSFSYDGAQVRQLADLEEALSHSFSRFASKALGALGATSGASFRGPVLLPPDCVAEFLVPQIISAASARGVRLGRSPLGGKTGSPIAVSDLTLLEAGPGLSEFPLCPFDREGLKRVPRPLIENGILQSLLYDTYEARAAGQEATGNAIGGASSLPAIGAEAIEVAPGEHYQHDLAAMDRGIILTRFSGSTNPTSGDFSGVVKGGFLVEDGEARPIHETTISGNIWTALRQIDGISREREVLYGTQSMPWIRIEDISVSAGQAG
jgi:PmbA protein